MGKPAVTFRSRFTTVWWYCTKLSVAGVGALFAYNVWDGGVPIQVPQIQTTLVCGLLCAIGMTIPIAYYGVYVSEDGIRSYDGFGIYHFVKWSAIEEVRPINMLGLRYLRIRFADSWRRLWIPLFLANMNGFRDLVSQFAGADHPLTRSLPLEARSTKR